MLHLKNLKNRLIKNNLLKNPMLDSIKISCPTIYDISTFIAYQLTLSFHENVNEDEIAFIALHVGTEIERQKKEETKVSCLLLCPEYYFTQKNYDGFWRSINYSKINFI